MREGVGEVVAGAGGIEAHNLYKRFGSLVAVSEVSLSVSPGEVFGFIGPNGAGKSTTMRMLAGLLLPDAGRATVCGFNVATQMQDIRMNLGYMPDFLGVYDDLTVDEYLQFFAAAYSVPRAKRRSVIDGVLELTDLAGKRHAMVDSLSRGMQQRLGIARVLVHDPKVLLLDEPASGLDPRARIELRELLLELKRMGKALMVSSHILSELAEMCTHIGIIEQGKMLFVGTIQEAYQRTQAGEQVTIEIEQADGCDPARAEAALLAEPIVRRVAREGHRLTVDLREAGSSHHALFELVRSGGCRVKRFVPSTVRLEDAFLTLTKGSVQ